MKSRRSVLSQQLKQLAELFGIQTHYLDDRKRPRNASPESIVGVLDALGVRAHSKTEARDSLRSILQERAMEIIPPVSVAWNQKQTRIPIRLPEQMANRSVSISIEGEANTPFQLDFKLSRQTKENAETVDGVRYCTKTVKIPCSLPAGYYSMTVETPAGEARSRLLRAPLKTFAEKASKRAWGVFAPLYALHSDRSWGGGDFGDLRTLIRWVSRLDGDVVATLPLLPSFLGKPCEPSPYSPVSRLFWNEFYIEVERIPELALCGEATRLMESNRFENQLCQLRKSDVVDYSKQMRAKRRVLEILACFFFSKDSPRRSAFNRHVRANPVIETYARFRAVFEKRQKSWIHWPAAMRSGEIPNGGFDPEIRDFYLYAQWIASEQMEALSTETRKRRMRLYLDMPLGVHSDGYDAWREQSLFALSASGGAPPDSVFTKGQDWGFAPIHPQRSRVQGHQYIVDYLRHHLKHAGMLRIDHVMGLHRLYWVPRGMPATHGAYVQYPAEEFYAVLNIESHKHRATIVGENLGTVPPEVNRSLARHGICEMFVSQYELRPHPRSAFRPVPRSSVASLNTHDMPPFRAFCEGLDITDRQDLGLLMPTDVVHEQRFRKRMIHSLRKLLLPGGRFKETEPHLEDLFRASLLHLGASPAELLLVNLEDLWHEVRSQNVPGTTLERVNWRRKTRLSIEQFIKDPGVLELLRTVHTVRHRHRKHSPLGTVHYKKS